jgi:hypothetical protein
LIATVPTSICFQKLLELRELIFARREYHHTRVEYIGPSYVRYRRELVVKVEQVGQGA